MQRHRAVVGWIGTAVALVVAVVYWFIVPEEAHQSTGLVHVVLRYGHSLVWILLAAAGATFALSGPKRLAAALAWAALGVYAVFLVTLLVTGPVRG